MHFSGFFLVALFIFSVLITEPAKAQWNPNTSVNILISNLPMADMQSASTTDGKTWIAFYHQNGGNYDMRAQLIDENGYKLLGDDGILVSNKTSGSATFVFNVCVDSSNNLIIAFQYESTMSMKAILHKISQSGNQLWGSDGIVLGDGLAPYPATLSNGEVIVAWNESNSNTLKLQKITNSGTLAWATPISIMVGTSLTTRGQIIANTAGQFTMVYQKNGYGISTTLYAQMFDNSGNALYAPLQICNQTTSGARYYSIAAQADTTYVGYYSSTGYRFNSFLQRINPGGTIPWGMNGSNFNTAIGTTDNYQCKTEINTSSGSNYVWSVCNFCDPNQTIYGVYIQKFLKTNGARQFTDMGKVVYTISADRDQQAGNLALIDDTPMFMSENDNNKLYATRLDASGNFIWPGNRVELSSTTATPSTPKMRYGFTPDGPNKCAGTWTENRGSDYKGYAQGISIGGLIGLTIATQGGVPATITTNNGTLQIVATVFPSTANQNVNWSIVPGTGMASISSSGLVTAISNGTAWAKATAVQDTTVKDSLMITMSNQTSQPPIVITLPATLITSESATFNGTVNANALNTSVSFEWGLTVNYGNIVSAIPPTVSGSSTTPVEAQINGLTSYTLYHFRVIGTNLAGTSYGEDLSFTTSPNVGIGEVSSTKVNLFPSPNNGRFSIEIMSDREISYTLDVYNYLGDKIYCGITIDGKNTIITTPVDLGNVQNGLYTVILRNDRDQIVRKILIIN